jgi:GNAT superfamily N-acetyltransferase
MPNLKPGDTIPYTVTYLEMTARPATPIPHMPIGASLALIAASNPPVDYFLYLYSTVGAVLDTRKRATCDLAYFGLVPQALGRGLSHWFLASAIHMAWDRPGVTKMTVDTSTLDHPRALALYQRMGFVPVRREDKTGVLTRAREV